jgi:hypothetical protein
MINRPAEFEEYMRRIVDHVRLVIARLTLRFEVKVRIWSQTDPQTRLYGCGMEGQFPHWYRVPMIVFTVISLLSQTSAEDKWKYL